MTEVGRNIDINTLPPADKAKRIFKDLSTVFKAKFSIPTERDLDNRFITIRGSLEHLTNDLMADRALSEKFPDKKIAGITIAEVGAIDYANNLAYIETGESKQFFDIKTRYELFGKHDGKLLTIEDIFDYLNTLVPGTYSQVQFMAKFEAAV